MSNFVLAWGKKAGFDPSLPTVPKYAPSDLYNMPYWMIFLVPSRAGAAKSLEEVIAWNVELGREAPLNIKTYADNYSQNIEQAIRQVAIARLAFAEFLKNNGMEQAGNLYEESGRMLALLAEAKVDVSAINRIASMEEQALQLMAGESNP